MLTVLATNCQDPTLGLSRIPWLPALLLWWSEPGNHLLPSSSRRGSEASNSRQFTILGSGGQSLSGGCFAGHAIRGRINQLPEEFAY